MSVVGLICAFEEQATVGDAIRSLLHAHADRVVVVDGAWTCPDGSYFGGGGFESSDRTAEEARGAGARVIVPPEGAYTDGSKRDWAIRNSGAKEGDHLLLLDADERIEGRIIPGLAPWGHGCIVVRNDKPNDLDERTPWLDPAVRASVPMLRWLRWTPELRCNAPGRYIDADGMVEPYVTGAMAAEADDYTPPALAGLAALRTVTQHLADEDLSYLAIVPDVVISHCIEASPERVEAKERYYDTSELRERDTAGRWQ